MTLRNLDLVLLSKSPLPESNSPPSACRKGGSDWNIRRLRFGLRSDTGFELRQDTVRPVELSVVPE